MKAGKKLTLAIETAIDGGSLSLSEGDTEIDCWIGECDVSKSEDVLGGLFTLLKRNSLKIEQINLIAVSTEAGSLTGLKIGLATAKGLTRASECSLIEISLWDALSNPVNKNLRHSGMIFLPSGKSGIVFRELEKRKFSSDTKIITKSRFQTDFIDSGVCNFNNSSAHHRIVCENARHQPSGNPLMFDLGKNFAKYIGQYASDNK